MVSDCREEADLQQHHYYPVVVSKLGNYFFFKWSLVVICIYLLYASGTHSSRKRSFQTKKESEDTSTDSTDASTTSDADSKKKIKLDPDFTPRKYEIVKRDLRVHKNTVKRITDLNFKLQDKINLLDSKVEEQEKKINNLTAELEAKSKILRGKNAGMCSGLLLVLK